MNRSRIKIRIYPLFWGMIFGAINFFSWGEGYGYTGEIVAIVNKSNKLKHLDLKDLENIFKGEVKYWEGGERVVLFLPPAGTEPMEVLTAKVFRKKNSKDIFKFYLKAIFQQKFNAPPKAVTSTGNAINRVTSIPGGIAIVDATEIPQSSQIKTIRVDGF